MPFSLEVNSCFTNPRLYSVAHRFNIYASTLPECQQRPMNNIKLNTTRSPLFSMRYGRNSFSLQFTDDTQAVNQSYGEGTPT